MNHLRSVHIIITITAAVLLSSAVKAESPLSPGLTDLLHDSMQSDSLVPVVVFLDGKALSGDRIAPMANRSRADRIQMVSRSLRTYKAPGLAPVQSFLLANSSTPVKRYWIAPALSATVPVSTLEQLSQLKGVRLVIEDVELAFDDPIDVSRSSSSLSAAVAAPLQQLNIPALWQQGLTGEGRLVCSFDTGVDHDHPALADKWRGTHAELSASWFSKVAQNENPDDEIGHGSHTMGVMVGSTPSDSFGVAPGAEWITAGIIDQGRPLSTTISDILEAFQWTLNPDGDTTTTDDVPDVILNSWGIPKGLYNPCDVTFAQVIENVEAAGIVTIFAAGNEGPNPATLRNPADMALTPLTTLAVGAVDANNTVANFSSRGPSSCNGAIKPELVAPGVSIRSSYKNGEYRILSGTSMAAPYIAGVVALLRQYNPDATVEQIKTALISAARDLGTTGEDNAYGYGILDAAQLLQYIPNPAEPDFALAGMLISDDGVALPGEQFGLQLTISNAPGNVDRAVGRLVPIAGPEVTMITDRQSFDFGVGGTIATNLIPYTIMFSEGLYNGQKIPFELHLAYNSGQDVDTLSFDFTVGVEPNGTMATMGSDAVHVTVSDFGQFGLAPGSIYNIQGEGFRVGNGENLLYEAGIVLARNELQLSSAVRNGSGHFNQSDFYPIVPLSDEWVGLDGGVHRSAGFDDRDSEIPIPIRIFQEAIVFPSLDNNALAIFKFYLHNGSTENVSNLHFGLLADFDLGGPEKLAYDADLQMLIQEADSQPMAAMVGLRNIQGYCGFDNGDSTKAGFSNSELFEAISADSTDLGQGLSDDRLFITHSGPFSIQAGDSVEISFALIGGYTVEDIYGSANLARQLYDQATSIDGGKETLPTGFTLNQNYPNPFNPTTTISFDLPRATDVRLTVYNTLGQEVTRLHNGRLPAGHHAIDWHTDGSHASGMYFYRLSTENATETRKMLLLK